MFETKMPPFSPSRDNNVYARPTMTTKTKSMKSTLSPTSHVGGGKIRRKRSRHQISARVSGIVRSFYGADLVAVLLLISMATIYVMTLDGESPEISNGLHESMQQPRKLSRKSHSRSFNSLFAASDEESNGDLLYPNDRYEGVHKGAPECRPLEYYEVTYGLAIALKESELNLVSQHCRRWGISGPISIAVWTTMTPEQVMDDLKSFDNDECTAEQMTISTVSPASKSSKETFPLNQLRNLAIQGLQTTHVIPLDIHVLPSSSLYDILHSPSAVQKLASDPKLAIVIPSFEAKEASNSKSGNFWEVPDTFESLVMHLSKRMANIMGSHDAALQGSTLYRSWVKQDPGVLVPIDCVSSDYYEPFVAVRYCEGLPPFQEVLSLEGNDSQDGDDSTNYVTSTWILHLMHLGYSFEQIGAGFVIGMQPGETANDPTGVHPKASLRRKRKFTRHTFLAWLHDTVPETRSVEKCEDFEDSTD